MYANLSSEIIFYYPLSTIVDRMKMYSQYQVRTTEDTDEAFLTSEDEELLMVEADRAIGQIFQIAMKLSKNRTNSVLSNTALTISGITYNDLYGFKLDNYHGFNPNILGAIDQNIEKLLTSLVLNNWYTITNKPDLVKIIAAGLPVQMLQYNNSLTELYKPYIGSVAPVYSTVETEIDDDSGEVVSTEIEETTTTNTETSSMNDPLYFDTFGDFPETGTEDMTYVDKSTQNMYLWNGTEYIQMNKSTAEFSVEFENVDTVTIQHNLGKLVPDIKMTDSDGQDWDVDYEPTDENSGVVEWEGNKTGTIYAS